MAEIADLQRRAERTVAPGSAWRHVRTGGVYEVVLIALREADMSPLVVYAPVGTAPRPAPVRFCRPMDEFADGRFSPLA